MTTAEDTAVVEDMAAVTALAELTATAPGCLHQALLTRTVAAGGGELIEKGHSPREAAYARDACAKVGRGHRVTPTTAPSGGRHAVPVPRPSTSGSSAGLWDASTPASPPVAMTLVCTARAPSSASSTSTASRSLTPTGELAQGLGGDMGTYGGDRSWEGCGERTRDGKNVWRDQGTRGGDKTWERFQGDLGWE